MASAAVVQEIHNVLQVCGISKLIACIRLIDNKGFNSLKDFGVMDRDMDMLDMANRLDSISVATRVNLGMVQSKGFKRLSSWSTTARNTPRC